MSLVGPSLLAVGAKRATVAPLDNDAVDVVTKIDVGVEVEYSVVTSRQVQLLLELTILTPPNEELVIVERCGGSPFKMDGLTLIGVTYDDLQRRGARAW